jgi:hypothetical protein
MTDIYQVQIRSGTSSQVNTFTGAAGELTYDSDTGQLRVHDGSTVGGLKLAFLGGPTFTGTVTIPTVDINGGTIDGTIIGGSTPAAASFTTFTSNGIDDSQPSYN